VAAQADERAARLRPAITGRGDRYALLLLLLIATYLLAAFTVGDFITIFESLLFVGTLLLALRTSQVQARTARLIIGGTLVGSVIVVALMLIHATSKDTAVGIANIWTGLVLLVTVGVILRRILAMPMVSLQSLFGAISAYMIIGLMFASFYSAMSHLDSQPFFANGQQGNTRTFQYFSFVTLTTTGYGDFTAARNAGRAVAVMEALGGQIFLATLVARLVASYRSSRANGAAPVADSIAGNPAPGSAPPGAADPALSAAAAGQTAAPRQAAAPGHAGGPRHAGVNSGTEDSGRDGHGTAGSGGESDRVAGGRPGPPGDGGQEVSRRGPGIPRRGSSRSRPARRAPVKWHGRRQR
jgi:Ion channel